MTAQQWVDAILRLIANASLWRENAEIPNMVWRSPIRQLIYSARYSRYSGLEIRKAVYVGAFAGQR